MLSLKLITVLSCVAFFQYCKGEEQSFTLLEGNVRAFTPQVSNEDTSSTQDGDEDTSSTQDADEDTFTLENMDSELLALLDLLKAYEPEKRVGQVECNLVTQDRKPCNLPPNPVNNEDNCVSQEGCCFDLRFVNSGNDLWCYQGLVIEKEEPTFTLPPQNFPPTPNPNVPTNLVPVNVQVPQVPATPSPLGPPIRFTRVCLFKCTAIPKLQRRSCSVTTDPNECTRFGCCFDSTEIVPQKRCFMPSSDDDVPNCPANDQCQIASGTIQECAPPGSSPTVCLRRRCCRTLYKGSMICYRKQDPNIVVMPAPTPTPVTTTGMPFFTLPPRVTTPTTPAPTTSGVYSILELLNLDGASITDEFTILEILSMTDEEIREWQERKLIKTTTTTTTTVAPTTTPTTTTPTTTTQFTTRWSPPPMTTPFRTTRRQCNFFGRCTVFTMPPNQVQNCIPIDCGVPRITPDTYGELTIDKPPPVIPGFGGTSPADLSQFASLLEGLKIAGGTRTYPFSHPWTGLLEKFEGERTYICGATLVCRQWLITAAHCLDHQTTKRDTADMNANDYKLYLGRWKGVKQEIGKQVQVFKGTKDIEVLLQHEKFKIGASEGIIDYDIALIKLRKPVILNQYVQPGCLPRAPPNIGDILFATGFGSTRDKGPEDTEMKQVGQMIQDPQKCRDRVPNFNDPPGILCAGGEPDHDTCTGDSGGPLVGPVTEGGSAGLFGGSRSGGTKRWYVYGITSVGSPSCNTLRLDRQPALYTDVSHYRSWILRNTNNCCA